MIYGILLNLENEDEAYVEFMKEERTCKSLYLILHTIMVWYRSNIKHNKNNNGNNINDNNQDNINNDSILNTSYHTIP